MTDAATLEQLDRDESRALVEQGRALKAKQLLGDPLLAAAFKDIRDGLRGAFDTSGPDDGPKREDVWRSLKLLDKIEGHLKRHLETGKLADVTLAEIEEKRRKWNLWKSMRGAA